MKDTNACPFAKDPFHRNVVRVIMALVFLVGSHAWVSLSLPKEANPMGSLGEHMQRASNRTLFSDLAERRV